MSQPVHDCMQSASTNNPLVLELCSGNHVLNVTLKRRRKSDMNIRMGIIEQIGVVFVIGVNTRTYWMLTAVRCLQHASVKLRLGLGDFKLC